MTDAFDREYLNIRLGGVTSGLVIFVMMLLPQTYKNVLHFFVFLFCFRMDRRRFIATAWTPLLFLLVLDKGYRHGVYAKPGNLIIKD